MLFWVAANENISCRRGLRDESHSNKRSEVCVSACKRDRKREMNNQQEGAKMKCESSVWGKQGEEIIRTVLRIIDRQISY